MDRSAKVVTDEVIKKEEEEEKRGFLPKTMTIRIARKDMAF